MKSLRRSILFVTLIVAVLLTGCRKAKQIPNITYIYYLENTIYTTEKRMYTSDPFTLPTETPGKDNFLLDGWYHSTSWEANDKIGESNFIISRDITLYGRLIPFEITYQLDGGTFYDYQTKEALRILYFTEFYHFICNQNPEFADAIDCQTFLSLGPVPLANFSVHNISVSSYYLNFKSTAEKQTTDKFIGYCMASNRFTRLREHLITFFSHWRDLEEVIEGGSKENAMDFYYSSWAALVDTAKYFRYNDGNDIIKAGDSGVCARDERILEMIAYSPPSALSVTQTLNPQAFTVLPKPEKFGYRFIGWSFHGQVVMEIPHMTKQHVLVTAKWEAENL